MRFELIASANIGPTGSLLAATFHEGVLNIPEASVGDSTYWQRIPGEALDVGIGADALSGSLRMKACICGTGSAG